MSWGNLTTLLARTTTTTRRRSISSGEREYIHKRRSVGLINAALWQALSEHYRQLNPLLVTGAAAAAVVVVVAATRAPLLIRARPLSLQRQGR